MWTSFSSFFRLENSLFQGSSAAAAAAAAAAVVVVVVATTAATTPLMVFSFTSHFFPLFLALCLQLRWEEERN